MVNKQCIEYKNTVPHSFAWKAGEVISKSIFFAVVFAAGFFVEFILFVKYIITFLVTEFKTRKQ